MHGRSSRWNCTASSSEISALRLYWSVSDIVRLDESMESTLTKQGMTINHVDIRPFKAAVREAGCTLKLGRQLRFGKPSIS